jgi:hypothetical protein
MEKKFEQIIKNICDTLNYMYEREYDNNEKVVEVFDIVKNDIQVISTNRECFFMMFDKMVTKCCNEKVNADYGFYEGLIVALCGGRI